MKYKYETPEIYMSRYRIEGQSKRFFWYVLSLINELQQNASWILLLEFSFPSVRSSIRPSVPIFDMHHTCMHHRYMHMNHGHICVGHTAWAPEGRKGRSQGGSKGRRLKVGARRTLKLPVSNICNACDVFIKICEKMGSQSWMFSSLFTPCFSAVSGSSPLREDINWKKTFSFGHCPNDGGGLPMPEFFGPLFRSAFLVN